MKSESHHDHRLRALGVACGIKVEVGRARVRQNPVEALAHGFEHAGIVEPEVEFGIGLPDALIVCVVDAGPQLPVRGAADPHHCIEIPRVFRPPG
jgi:hypothetical protein